MNIYGYCLIFNHHNINIETNNCKLLRSDTHGYGQCLRCYVKERMTSLDNITIEQNCLPLPNLHCIDLYFNDIELYRDFTLQYNDLINQLFDKEDRTSTMTQNSLIIHIENDSLNEFTFDTFRSLDNVKNRSYHLLRFDLTNRDDRLPLSLNRDIENMTLVSLQINIYCSSKGLYQYNYVPSHQYQPLLESFSCEIPVTTSSTTSTIITKNTDEVFSTVLLSTTSSTKNIPQNFVLIFSLLGGGSLIPCFLLACCIYIFCKRNNEQNDINNERTESIGSNETDSIFSYTSLS